MSRLKQLHSRWRGLMISEERLSVIALPKLQVLGKESEFIGDFMRELIVNIRREIKKSDERPIHGL
jgi:hypothetical protein